MSSKTDTTEYRFDAIKWVLVIALVVAGIVANSVYADMALYIKAPALVAVAIIALFIAANTSKGGSIWTLVREAFVEVRKVVWPTTQETNQTTLIVCVVVLITALLLWGLDAILGKIASIILG